MPLPSLAAIVFGRHLCQQLAFGSVSTRLPCANHAHGVEPACFNLQGGLQWGSTLQPPRAAPAVACMLQSTRSVTQAYHLSEGVHQGFQAGQGTFDPGKKDVSSRL